MRYHWIYDTPALVGHATGASTRVRAGLHMVMGRPDAFLTVPATCLLEAYGQAPRQTHHLLDALATSPGVTVTPAGDEPQALPAIGELVRETGRPGAAQAAYLALAGDGPCLVFTDVAMPAGVLSRPA